MQKITSITSKDNPAVKHYKKLRDNKKIRRTEQLFVIEGLRIVRDALQYPFLIQQIFITETCWNKYQNILQQELQEMQLFHIPNFIGDYLADTEHTQGIFAICKMPCQKPISELLRSNGRYLVLCNLQDTGNMGMILRTCDALGIDAILTTGCCELYSPKTIRSAMGSALRVSVWDEPNAMHLLETLQTQKIYNYASVPEKTAISLTNCHFQDGCAVWIGNEGNGLPEEIISACDTSITIPMRGGAESFNAAMAAGLVAWELSKTK